jgi:L,D-transpeptidase catalytic domain
MKQWWRTLLDSPRLAWPVVALLALADGTGIYVLARDYAADAAKADQIRAARRAAAVKPPKPKAPPPPAMIHPPPVEAMLRSGTLIVISKKSQNMFVFSNGALWASSPISTGKRRHETPSGVFPILQKRQFHRSNIYSNAPMPFMQRLTWDGIALHAGWVPGYPASHGCVRIPRTFAQSLFKLTTMPATTVVIGDDPLETEAHAQQFALSAKLPVRSALAPPVAQTPIKSPATVVAAATAPGAVTSPVPSPPPPRPAAVPVPPGAHIVGSQTIQLTAAASAAEAEAHWERLLKDRPDFRRFAKSVEAAQVNSRRVYRLRMSGPDAHSYCMKLKQEGLNCLNVS